jgi:hypothetical protein
MPEEIRDRLNNWLNRIDENSAVINRWNETEIQSYVTNPLLNALGWDATNPQKVKREVPVTMGRETKRADYLLLSESNHYCVIETKAGASPLDDQSCRQSISYAVYLKSTWAIIMNGERLYLFDVGTFNDNNPMNSLVMELNFFSNDKDNLLESLKYLAGGTFDTEEGKRKLKELKTLQDIRKVIGDRKETILNDVIPDWVKNQLGQEIDQTLLRNIVKEIFGAIQPPPQPIEPIKTQPRLQGTTTSDWTYNSKLGKGVFVYNDDPNKKINVDCPSKELEAQLKKLGLGPNTPQAIFGISYRLRRIAGLIRKRR